MDNIKVKLVKAHEDQMIDYELKRELKSIQDYIDKIEFEMLDKNVYFLFVKGLYDSFKKKMNTIAVFINNTGNEIVELHGVLRFTTKVEENIKFAKTTIDFDEPFMGTLRNREAILIHLNIPVKGLECDREFNVSGILNEFSDVKVKYAKGDK